MGDIFNLDNRFFQGLNKLIDCVGLSVIWLACCIPVITAGAATTALYYAINKVIRHSRGYVWREFWHAFKVNFKQSTVVWLILLAASIVLGADGYIMYRFSQAGEKAGFLYIVFIALLALVVMWAIYLFPYIARFENATKQILKNAALIAIGNLGKTLIMFLIFLAAWFVGYIMPVTMVFVPAVFMIIINLLMEKIFRKYMSKEDLAAEEERNQEFYN